MRQVKKALKEQQKQQKQQQKRPKKDCPQGKASSTVTFSEKELVKLAQRYENGYDVTTDDQYSVWLQRFHPTEGKTSVPCKLYKHVQMYLPTTIIGVSLIPRPRPKNQERDLVAFLCIFSCLSKF